MSKAAAGNLATEVTLFSSSKIFSTATYLPVLRLFVTSCWTLRSSIQTAASRIPLVTGCQAFTTWLFDLSRPQIFQQFFFV